VVCHSSGRKQVLHHHHADLAISSIPPPATLSMAHRHANQVLLEELGDAAEGEHVEHLHALRGECHGVGHPGSIADLSGVGMGLKVVHLISRQCHFFLLHVVGL
jgi:hypothetical protein